MHAVIHGEVRNGEKNKFIGRIVRDDDYDDDDEDDEDKDDEDEYDEDDRQ